MPEEFELLKEWKLRLGLTDWFIVLETNVKPDKMELQDADGCVSYEETIKAAKIQIIDPNERKNNDTYFYLRNFDFEETLVHELLHIKLCLLERGNKWDKKLQLRLLHQMIDDLARALVNAKRTNIGQRKEEVVKPTLKTIPDEDAEWYECSYCQKGLDLSDKYCPECGRRIEWEIK